MRFARRFTDSDNGINRCCEKKLPTRLQHPATSKTSCVISSRSSKRKDINYTGARHELHQLSRSFERLRAISVTQFLVFNNLCLNYFKGRDFSTRRSLYGDSSRAWEGPR